ncbi:MAG TPA: hypothetical protein VD978_18365 [Azospirillum sp.]|nr:hypothetical protein [Azospirillum sp.]
MVWQAISKFGSSRSVASVANILTITGFAFGFIEKKRVDRLKRINETLKNDKLSLEEKNEILQQENQGLREDKAFLKGKLQEAHDQYVHLEVRSEQYLQAKKDAESCGLQIIVVPKK